MCCELTAPGPPASARHLPSLGATHPCEHSSWSAHREGKKGYFIYLFLMSLLQTWDQRLQTPSVPPVQLGLAAELQAPGCFTAPNTEPRPAQQLRRDVQLTATAPDPGHPQGHPGSSRDPWKGWAGQERAGEGRTAQEAGEQRAWQCPACLLWSLGSSTASTRVLWDIWGHLGPPQAPRAEPSLMGALGGSWLTVPEEPAVPADASEMPDINFTESLCNLMQMNNISPACTHFLSTRV